jgi:hypothetical protein
LGNKSHDRVSANPKTIQKQRVESGQITASTLKSFIKSLKVFCDSADADASPYHFLQELQFFKASENAVAPIC